VPEPKTYHRERQFALRERLPIWVFAGQWIARMHLTIPTPEPTNLIIVGENLEDVRTQLPEGLTNIGRQPGDDPVIAEVWI